MTDYAEQFAMSKYTSSADRSAAMLAELERLTRELAEEMEHTALLRTERDKLLADIHSCGPTCTRAGCVAAGLRADAERWRWVIQPQTEGPALFLLGDGEPHELLTGERAIAEVDEARGDAT